MTRSGYEKVKCGKCNGSGQLRGFKHYADGVCFDCMGKGTIEVSLATVAANKRPRAETIRLLKRLLDIVQENANEGDAFRDYIGAEIGHALAHADADVYERAIAALKRVRGVSKGEIQHALTYIERARQHEIGVLAKGRRRTYGRDPERRRKIPAGSLKRRRSRR